MFSVCPFAHRHVLELEVVRAVAGLGVFELDAVVVEGLAGDDGHTVVIIHFNIGFVDLGDALYRHGAFAGGDGKAKGLLQIFIDGMLCDLRRQPRNQILSEIIVIQDQRRTVQVPEALQVVQRSAQGKAGFPGNLFPRLQLGELKHLCAGRLAVADGGFQKGLDAAYGKGGLKGGLVNIAHALSLHGLYIAVGGQLGERPPDGIPGAAVFLYQGMLRRKQLLVGEHLRLNLFL